MTSLTALRAFNRFVDTLEDCVNAAANFRSAMEEASKSLKENEPPTQFGAFLGGFMKA